MRFREKFKNVFLFKRKKSKKSPASSGSPLSPDTGTAVGHSEHAMTENELHEDPRPEVTPNTQELGQPLQPIATLWDEAFDDLASNQETQELMEVYQRVIMGLGQGQDVPQAKDERRKQLDDVIITKTAEIEDGRWKVRFKDNEFVVKDLVQPVISIVEWGKGFVGSAVQPSPAASLAWAGVCLLLPLILNPNQQEASRVKGLEKIASILRECSLRESLYQNQYEAQNCKANNPGFLKSHCQYRDSIKVVYSLIIKFQSKYVCFLGKHNTAGRLAQDMVKWEDWDGMVEDIQTKNENLKVLDKMWERLAVQEEWEAIVNHHKEKLERLDAIQTEIQRFSARVREAQLLGERKELLSWLQTVKPSVHYDAAVEKRRKYPTGAWFLESSEYKEWKGEPNSFLWVQAKAGAGKSVLSATIIENLSQLSKENPYSVVVYFYISANDRETIRVNNLTRSLMTQLFGLRPDYPEALSNLDKYKYTSGAPPQSDLEAALRSAVADFDQTYVVIDGLDECPASGDQVSVQGERRMLLEMLEMMHSWELDNLHILVTSRHEQDIKDALDSIVQSPHAQVVDLSNNNVSSNVSVDMKLFIDNELEKGPCKALTVESKDQIKEKLMAKADGVFHYVVLQLDSFRPPVTKSSVKRVLSNLPKDLNETYEKTLGRLETCQRSQATRALTWVAFSEVPLSIVELATAVTIDFTTAPAQDADTSHGLNVKDNPDLVFNDDDKLEDPSQVLYLLPGLHDVRLKENPEEGRILTNPVEGPQQVVVLTHFTLLEYLTSEGIKNSKAKEFSLSKVTGNAHIAEACLRYHIYLSLNSDSAFGSSIREDYPLYEYAASYGLQHADMVGRAAWSASLERLVRIVLQPGSQHFFKLKQHSNYSSPRNESLPIQYVVDKGFLNITSFLFDEGLAEVNMQPEEGEALIIQGVKNMNKPMVRLLLGTGAIAKTATVTGEPALYEAVRNKDIDMVQLLVDFDADVNEKTKGGEPPLILAVKNNDVRMVELLLAKGADVNSTNVMGDTALFQAIFDADIVLMGVVLGAKPNLCAKKGDGATALHWAVSFLKRGSERKIKDLLDQGAEVNARTEAGETPLHWAASSGRDWAIELLMDKGADINATTDMGDTALHLAAKMRDTESLEVLLKYSPDINAVNRAGETALFLAARALY